jgi:hypothetical protein
MSLDALRSHLELVKREIDALIYSTEALIRRERTYEYKLALLRVGFPEGILPYGSCVAGKPNPLMLRILTYSELPVTPREILFRFPWLPSKDPQITGPSSFLVVLPDGKPKVEFTVYCGEFYEDVTFNGETMSFHCSERGAPEMPRLVGRLLNPLA